MALSTSSADIWRGVSWLVMDAGGMSVSGWGVGCLALRAERVSSSRSLMVSSKEARRTAPLKSPSSSLEDIQAARDSQDWWDGLCGRLLEGCWSGSPSSLITWVARVAKVLRCPARFGVRRQRTEKRKRRSQQLVEFSLTTSSIIARSRAARGILFRILTFGGFGLIAEFAIGSEEPGACRGGLLEPGQRLVTGPCVRIIPNLVTGISRWHTEQGVRSALWLRTPKRASLSTVVEIT